MANFFKASVLIFVFNCFFPSFANAQIMINETLNNPSGEEKGAEWVELKNLSDSPQPLDDCVLHLDNSQETQKVVFSQDDFIEKYKVVSWDKSWLNNSGDEIRIVCQNFSDTLVYGNSEASVVPAPSEGVSIGRYPDGTGGFFVLSSVTLGGTNSPPPTNTPTPSLTPLPTLKPTVTLKPVSANPTSFNNSISQRPTEVTFLTPTETRYLVASEAGVLGDSDDVIREMEDFRDLVSTPTVFEAREFSENTNNRKRFPFFALVLAIIGATVIIVSLTPFLRKIIKKKE